MKLRDSVVGTIIVITVCMPGLFAQRRSSQVTHKHHHYQIIDVGTLGGAQSTLTGGRGLNNQGTLVGCADTSTPNPNYPNLTHFSQPLAQIPFSFTPLSLRTPWEAPKLDSSNRSPHTGISRIHSACFRSHLHRLGRATNLELYVQGGCDTDGKLDPRSQKVLKATCFHLDAERSGRKLVDHVFAGRVRLDRTLDAGVKVAGDYLGAVDNRA
jgi:hypothetical protein